MLNIENYGTFINGSCLEDNEYKSLEYINNNTNKSYVCYFYIGDIIKNNTHDFFFNDLNISYKIFPWKTYLKMHVDVKNSGSDTKEYAWNHFKNYGKYEERAFSYINNSNVHTGRLGNLFFINMFLNMMAMKYNLKCSYKYAKKFKQLGINFYKGINIYDTNLLVTEKNFMYLLKEKLEPSNIIITNEVYFQTNEFCQILHRYFNLDKIKNKIINSNIYNTRYNQNNDLFIHVRLGDIKNLMQYNYNILDDLISKIKYDEVYISSDSIEDKFCVKLIKKYNLRVYISNDIETIMFANTCNKIIMSGGTFSWMLGFFGYFSKNIYYLNSHIPWYGDIFCFNNWKNNENINYEDKNDDTIIKENITVI